MKAQYFLQEKNKGWEECTVIDISRRGMGLRFLTNEKISVGSTLHLEISMPTELETINVKGILKRINQRGNDCIGGIEWFLVQRDGFDEDGSTRVN
jgi:hypothetical protein